MLRPIVCGFLLLMPVLGPLDSGAAAAADDVLQVVPHDVLGVVVVNKPAESNRKLKALTDKLQLPVPDVLSAVRQKLGGLEGIDGGSSLAVAAVPPEGGGGPSMVFFLPVRDYDQLLRSANAGQPEDGIAQGTVADRPTLIARKGNFALLTEPSGRGALTRALSANVGLAGEMAAITARVAQADIYAAAAPAGIKLAQQQLLAGLASAKTQLEQQGEQGRQAIMGLSIYENLFRSIDKEITHAVAGVQIEEGDAVRIVMGAALAPEGTLAKLGGAATTPRFDLLGDLPQDDFLFAGGGILPEQWGEQMITLSMNMMKMYFGQLQLTEEQMQTMIDASLKSMQGMRGMAMMMGLPDAGQPLYGNTLLVIKTADAAAYMKNYAAAMQEMQAAMKGMENPPFSYELRPVQVGGVSGLAITMDMTGMLNAQGVPQVEQLFKLMFGSTDGVSFYLAPRDETTVLGTYVSQARLEQFLKQENSEPLSQDVGVAKTLALLPETAQGVALWSVPGTFKFVSQVLGALQPDAAIQIPQFPASPPIGFAVSMSAERLDMDVVLPGDLLQAAAGFAQQMRGAGPQTR